MQRNMQCVVTCCTVTSTSLLAILCLASGRSEDTRFTGKRMEQHRLLIQWNEGRFTALALAAAPPSREQPRPMSRPSWSAHRHSIAMRSLQGRNTMTSQPIRNQVEDHLLTPKNATLIIIDYQPPQVSSIVSMDHLTLVANIVAVARLAKLYALPIVLSTVNVKTGLSAPTIHQLAEVLAGIEELDRTTINAWEDEEFVTAVKATGRKKLIMAALWTEACLSFPALDALRERYEGYPVVDAVGGTSVEAHRAGLERIVQAGAQPTSVVQLMCELQRDWARTETVQPVREILYAREGS